MDLHEIVSKIKILSKELGKTPSIRDMTSKTDVSKRQIHNHGWNNLCRKAGLEPNTNTHKFKGVKLEKRQPKIFCFDLEILPMEVKSYGLYNQNIKPSRVVKDWSILSWAGKFLDKEKIYYYDTSKRKNKRDDSKIVKQLHDKLKDADMILGHNMDRFDIKKANAKFLELGLEPLSFSKKIDTLKIARKYFKFTSNSLDYLARKLGVTPKRKSPKFTQEDMWDQCELGNQEAFKENKLYNIQDIHTTIEVYDKLKAWDESLNFQSFYGETVCVCGNNKFKRDGFCYTKQSSYQMYACNKCGKRFSSKTNLIHKDDRKGFFR